jgi:hypothetical protein
MSGQARITTVVCVPSGFEAATDGELDDAAEKIRKLAQEIIDTKYPDSGATVSYVAVER